MPPRRSAGCQTLDFDHDLLVALEGLEPPTQGLGRPRSIHLNYRAIDNGFGSEAPYTSVLDE